MKIAEEFSDWLILNGASKDDREVYVYGVECFVNEIISDSLLLLFACLFKRPFQMVIWLLFFTIIRINVGGYHAKTHYKCILLSTLLGCICIMVYPFLPLTYMRILSILSLIIIIKIAPVIHENHPVSEKRKKQIRLAALLISTSEVLLILITFQYNHSFAAIVFTSLSAAALLGIIGYIRNLKNGQI